MLVRTRITHWAVVGAVTLQVSGCRQPVDAPPVLYVNQLLPSTLHWKALGLNVTLASSLYGDDGTAPVSLEFAAAGGGCAVHGPPPTTVHLKVGAVALLLSFL